MKKAIIMVCTCVIIVFAVILLIIMLIYGNGKIGGEDLIQRKETALKIGVALLEENYPYAFRNPDVVFDAEEKDGIWRVNNIFESSGVNEDGTQWTIEGGVVYVEFRKDNGAVIRMGIDD